MLLGCQVTINKQTNLSPPFIYSRTHMSVCATHSVAHQPTLSSSLFHSLTATLPNSRHCAISAKIGQQEGCCRWFQYQLPLRMVQQRSEGPHTRSSRSHPPSSIPLLPFNKYQCWYCSAWIVLHLSGQDVDHFLSPLLFPSGDRCCPALFYQYSASARKPVDELSCLLCLPVCLPVHSL